MGDLYQVGGNPDIDPGFAGDDLALQRLLRIIKINLKDSKKVPQRSPDTIYIVGKVTRPLAQCFPPCRITFSAHESCY